MKSHFLKPDVLAAAGKRAAGRPDVYVVDTEPPARGRAACRVFAVPAMSPSASRAQQFRFMAVAAFGGISTPGSDSRMER